MPRSLLRFGAILWTVLVVAARASAQTGAQPYRDGEILLKFTASAPLAYRAAVLSDLGATDVKQLGRQAVLQANISGLSVEAAVARYRNRPGIEYVEPNYIYKVFVTPNDPLFDQLWGLRNTGQAGGTSGADVHATAAWSIFTGSHDVVVGIIDTGIDYNHPDLAANIWTNPGEIPGNGIDDDHNGYVDDIHGYDFVNGDGDPMDDHGHGTHCAGTIGGVGNNAIGVAGINWNVRLMALKFLDAGGFGSTSAAILAVDYATAMGAKLTSNSWGGGGFSTPLLNSIQAANTAGVLFVAAAGNASSDNDLVANYPSNYDVPNIIAVAATDRNDLVASFSNYGATTVDLGAPGVDILSTVPGASYGLKSGTSMATPHVSGAVALILGRFPGIPAASAKALLLAGVDPIPSLAGRCVTGGRLNILQPIAEPDSLPPGPITDLAIADANGSRIGLQWTATGDDGSAGRASSYEVRYSTAPIDTGNFASALPASGAPDPGPAGTTEHMTVSGLAFATTYYFALRPRDEVGNPGPLSNVATGLTLGPPDISVPPVAASRDLLTGETATVSLPVSNVGVSDLQLEIQIHAASTAATKAVQVTRTLARLRPGAASEQTAPGPDYRAGHGPARAALRPGDVRIPALPARIGMRVLLAWGGGDPAEMQSLLAAFPDVATVDVFDLLSSTPTLPDLMAYDGVLVANGNPVPNAEVFGDVLADYADAGGSVVLTLASFISGFEVRGRLLSGNYMPFQLGTGPAGSSTLGSFDASHPIMAGVTSAYGDVLGSTTPAAGAQLVASWSNGFPCVAVKGPNVSAVNVFVATAGYWSGDVPVLLHNALVWGAHRIGWLTADPTAAIIPAGATLVATLRLDATGLNGGDYDAVTRLVSNDPDEPQVDVPVHMHVTGAPDILVEGERVSIESTQSYTFSGASTTHTLPVTIPPPGGGTLELIADGDYGQAGEFATVIAEGRTLGTVGPTTADCTQLRGTFQLSAADLAALAADGHIEVMVQNSPAVDVFCTLNQHRLVVTYNVGIDPLDFGHPFLGGCTTRHLFVSNVGTDQLAISGAALDNARFAIDATPFTLAPGEMRQLTLTFCPTNAVVEAGALSISSNDPDEAVMTVAVRGEGLLPPDIDVSPVSFSDALLTGQRSSHTLHIANVGLSPLEYSLALRSALPLQMSKENAAALLVRPHFAATGEREDRNPQSTQPPPGFRSVMTPAVRRAGAQVALVQDVAPWGTQADENVLTALGVHFDRLPSEELAAVHLANYRLLIVAGDQPTQFYERLSAQAGQLEAWVANGGVLEVHATGWGYAAGDASLFKLPGGIGVEPESAAEGRLLAREDALLRDVPDPIMGTTASSGFFTAVPATATILACDLARRPTLLSYRVGAGHVVATCLNVEYGWIRGEDAGQLLANMLRASIAQVPNWLGVNPVSGTIPAGGAEDVTVTLDAAGLYGGDYAADIQILSNDPDESQVGVPVSLHVTGAPDIAIAGEPVVLESAQTYSVSGAATSHSLSTVIPPAGNGTVELVVDGDYGDFGENATLTVEGTAFGAVGALGIDCSNGVGSFPVDIANLAAWFADGIAHAQVQNSTQVDAFCTLNQHRVRITYPTTADSVNFGTQFIGGCNPRTLVITNAGTDLLTVSSIATSNPVFTPSASSFALAPGTSQTLILNFCPTDASTQFATLTVQSDDPDEATATVALVGQGLIAPDIAVSPDAIHADLFSGETAVRTLRIDNTGGSPLLWSAAVAVPQTVTSFVPAASAAVGTNNTGQSMSSTVAGVRPLAPGDFHPLSTSPAVLACVAVDPTSDAVYAQENFGTQFFRYDPGLNAWQPLQPSLVYSGNNGGAVCLNGKIYTCYAENPSQLGVYDIASNSWGILANGLGSGTGNITTDGHYLYLVVGSLFARYDPVTLNWTPLALSPVEFSPWGGLQYFAGKLYGHTGNGNLGFASYDITTGTWTILPSVPGGAVLGSAIDPVAGTYYTYGSYGGTNWYAFDVASASWSVATIPFFPVGDGGMAYVQGGGAGIYFVQGEYGIGFGRFETNSWLRVSPASGSIAAGAAQEVSVVFDAAGLIGADYAARVVVASNDPDENPLSVPATLHVTGAPDIKLSTAGLNFGDVFVGGTATQLVTVSNTGTDVLHVTGVGIDDAAFHVSPAPFALAVHETRDIEVQFSPTSPIVSHGILTFTSDDPDEGTIPVTLIGQGLVAPDIAVSPDSIHADLFSGGHATRTLTIDNTGGSPLVWNAGVDFSQAATAPFAPPADAAVGTNNSGQSMSSRVTGVHPLAPGDFHPLASSPATMTCVTVDPTSSVVYAQENFGTRFFRYTPGLNAWQPLPSCPLYSGNNGGGVYLNGKIYTCYTENGIQLGVYDIAAGSWTTLPNGAGFGTGNIATDGHYLYLVGGVLFARYDPGTLSWTALTSPPGNFTPWGGLQCFAGKLYGHTGDGSTAFARYDISGGTWTVLPAIPGGAVLGSAIDPIAGVYYAYGSYGGNNWYAFDIANSTWNAATIPLFQVGDGGMAYVQGSAPGIYFVQGEQGFGLGRFETASWLHVSPTSGTIAAGASQELAVEFDATGLIGGDYAGHVVIASNDPNENPVNVPATLHVTGAPDIAWSPPAVAFGEVFVGATGSTILRVQNEGTDILHVTRVALDNPVFRADSTGFSLAVGQSRDLVVRFLPVAPDLSQGSLTLTSDDPDEGTAVVALTGLGRNAPDIDADPDTVIVQLPPGAATTRTFTLSNIPPGGSTLNWEIQVVPAPPPFAAAASGVKPEAGGAKPQTGGVTPLSVPWMQVSPLTGSLAGGESAPITLVISAPDEPTGAFGALVTITSNDPDEPTIVVRVGLSIITAPRLTVTPTNLDFGVVYLGYPVQRSLIATNVGSGPLTVTGVVAGLPGFVAGPSQFTLAPAASQQILVFAFPPQVGERTTTLVFTSNDPESPLSLPVHATALIAPAIGATPSVVDATVTRGRTAIKTIEVCNTGGSDLRFQATALENSGTPVPQQATVFQRKGEETPAPGILGSGGPDAFGYRWTDSDHPGGPAFGWVDITSTGTTVPFASFADEANLGPFPIGFSFPFYGDVFSTFRVCTNGYVSFTSNSSSFANQALPNNSGAVPENLLAPLWDDLLHSTSAGSQVLYLSDASRCIIQFNNMVRFNEGAPYGTFQIILYPSGDIAYQYKTLMNTRTSATVGLQNANRDDGLTVAFNAPYLHPNLAIQFKRPKLDWLQASPSAGVVPPGQCTTVKLLFDAAHLAVGDRTARLLLTSNDPARVVLWRPVNLHVTAELASQVALSPNVIDLSVRNGDLTVYIEPPAASTPADIDVASLRVNGTVPPLARPPLVGDHDGNLIPDLAVQFDRAAVGRTLWDVEAPLVVVTGDLVDRRGFRGDIPVQLIRHQVLAPNGGEHLSFGATEVIRWAVPGGWTPDHADVLWSADDSGAWTVIAAGVHGTSVNWTPPHVATTSARVRVVLYDAVGAFSQDTSNHAFTIGPVASDVAERTPPARTGLFQNHPNPFNPTTSIEFELATPGVVHLTVYDATGARIRSLVNGWRSASRHEVLWDGRDARNRVVPSGLYFYRLETASYSETRRMILLK